MSRLHLPPTAAHAGKVAAGVKACRRATADAVSLLIAYARNGKICRLLSGMLSSGDFIDFQTVQFRF
jgi:hypothetical protein